MATSYPHARLPARFWWWRNENRWPSGSRRIDTQVIIMTGGFGPGADSHRKHDILWHHAGQLSLPQWYVFSVLEHALQIYRFFFIVCFYFLTSDYITFSEYTVFWSVMHEKCLVFIPVIVRWKYKNNAARTPWSHFHSYSLAVTYSIQTSPTATEETITVLPWVLSRKRRGTTMRRLGKKHEDDFGQEQLLPGFHHLASFCSSMCVL